MSTNPSLNLTEAQARILAKHDRSYSARKGRDGRWCVWCGPSDHHVEFSDRTLAQFANPALETSAALSKYFGDPR